MLAKELRDILESAEIETFYKYDEWGTVIGSKKILCVGIHQIAMTKNNPRYMGILELEKLGRLQKFAPSFMAFQFWEVLPDVT